MDADTFAALMTEPARSAIHNAITLLDAGRSALEVSGTIRRHFPTLTPPVATAVIGQATFRRRGRAKFGAAADDLWFTPDGLEQASSDAAAHHRATRFARLANALGRPPRVADLCCGIGGDLRALDAGGCTVTGVDRDPITVLAARVNVPTAKVECEDVESVDLAGYDAVFIDPARRADGRRTFDVRQYAPPWPFVTELLARMPATAAKVAPGIPHDLIPIGIETEWVSIGGTLKEAVLWAGGLRDGTNVRRATLLPTGATMTSISNADEPASAGSARRYLYEPDDAVVRAHLIGDLTRSLDGVLLDRSTAYITSDVLVDSPFARAFEITEVMPFSLKRLRAALREADVGGVTIMKRGSAINVEQFRRDLRLKGEQQAVVVLALIAGRHHAVIAAPAHASGFSRRRPE